MADEEDFSLPRATALNMPQQPEDDSPLEYRKGGVYTKVDFQKGDFIMFEAPMVNMCIMEGYYMAGDRLRDLLSSCLMEQFLAHTCILCQMAAYALSFSDAISEYEAHYQVKPTKSTHAVLICPRMQGVWKLLCDKTVERSTKKKVRAFFHCHAMISSSFFSYESYWSKNNVYCSMFCFRCALFRRSCLSVNVAVAVCHDGVRLYADTAIPKGTELVLPVDDPLLGMLDTKKRQSVLIDKRNIQCECVDCKNTKNANLASGLLFSKLMRFIPISKYATHAEGCENKGKEETSIELVPTLQPRMVREVANAVLTLDNRTIVYFILHGLSMMFDIEKFAAHDTYVLNHAAEKDEKRRDTLVEKDLDYYARVMSVVIHRLCLFLYYVAQGCSHKEVMDECPVTHTASLKLFGTMAAVLHKQLFPGTEFARMMGVETDLTTARVLRTYKECIFDYMLQYNVLLPVIVEEVQGLVTVKHAFENIMHCPFLKHSFWNDYPDFATYTQNTLNPTDPSVEDASNKVAPPIGCIPRVCDALKLGNVTLKNNNV